MCWTGEVGWPSRSEFGARGYLLLVLDRLPTLTRYKRFWLCAIRHAAQQLIAAPRRSGSVPSVSGDRCPETGVTVRLCRSEGTEGEHWQGQASGSL